MSIRHITPTLRIGQRTTITREIQLIESSHGSDPLDLSDAESVTLTLEHYEWGFTAIQGGECTIVEPAEGIVEYTFDQSDTSLHGRYLLQFEVDYGSETELVPSDSDDWVLDIGRRQPKYQPLDVPSITADEGTFGHVQSDTIDIGSATINEVVGDPNIDHLSVTSFEAGSADIDSLTGPLDAGGQPIDNVGDSPSIRGVVPQEYVDQIFSDNYVEGMSNPATADFELNNHTIVGGGQIGTPAAPMQAVYTGRVSNVRFASAFDGANAAQQLQAAIDDLPAGGGCVFADMGGEWPETVTYPSNITIVGDETTAFTVPASADFDPITISRAGGTLEMHAALAPKDPVGGESDVTVKGITIDFPDADLKSGRHIGLCFQNVVRPTVENCSVSNIKYEQFAASGGDTTDSSYGVLFAECIDAVVRGGHFYRAAYENIAIGDSNDGVLIEGVRIGDGHYHSMQTSRSDDVRVKNCRIKNTETPLGGRGFTSHGSTNVRVEGTSVNTIEDSALWFFDGSEYITVDNCTLTTARSAGRSHAIRFGGNPDEGGGGLVDGLTVTGGTTADAEYGLYCYDNADDVTVSGVDFENADTPLRIPGGDTKLNAVRGRNPDVQLVSSTQQTIPPGSFEVVEFDTFRTGNVGTLANNTWTPDVAGKFHINFVGLATGATSTGDVTARPRRVGWAETDRPNTTTILTGGQNSSAMVTDTVELTPDDGLFIEIRQRTGGDVDLSQGPQWRRLQITRLE